MEKKKKTSDLEEEMERARSCRDLNKKIKVARNFTRKTENGKKKEIGKNIAYKLEMKKREDC